MQNNGIDRYTSLRLLIVRIDGLKDLIENTTKTEMGPACKAASAVLHGRKVGRHHSRL